jgi:transcriptional regulator with XRE-family HTH domain
MRSTKNRLPEIYMRVRDPKQIKKLMVIQEVTTRQLASAAGYQTHSYITRILRGEIKTVTPDRAARIAHFFGVGVDDLFVARLSSDAGPTVQKRAS